MFVVKWSADYIRCAQMRKLGCVAQADRGQGLNAATRITSKPLMQGAHGTMASRLRFKPKLRKIAELLLYLSHKKQGVDHYKACKLLYLADWAHLNRFGRPMIGDMHRAMEWGPVASKTYELLKGEEAAMKGAGLEALPFETKKLDKIIHIGPPKRAVDHKFFSRSDLEVFDQILAEYGDLTFAQLHDETSRHFAYRNAWDHKGETQRSAPIDYDDMLEETATKEDYVDEISLVSHKM